MSNMDGKFNTQNYLLNNYTPKTTRPVRMMHTLTREEWRIQEIIEKHANYLYNLGALAIGIGNHSLTDKPCIVIHVNQKNSQMSALKELDGYSIDIIETDGIVSC
jgi:hypothetical protein